MVAFLAEAYKFKEFSDYGIDESQSVTLEEAVGAIANAGRFLEVVAASLEREE